MVKSFTGHTVYPGLSSAPNPNYTPPANIVDSRDRCPEALHSLTLSPRGVLVARVPEHTSTQEMENIRTYLNECFPNNKVVVLWDTIKLFVVEDEGWRGRMTPDHDTSSTYY